MMHIKRFIFFVVMIAASNISAMNIIRPYQILLRPPRAQDSRMQVYGIGQFGFESEAFGINGSRVNPLQIFECFQNALTMLNGFDACSPVGQLSARINAESNCSRGRFIPEGKFKTEAAAHFGLRFFFEHNISLAFYLPYYSMRLYDVAWHDQTGNTSIQDARTHAYLTDCLGDEVCELGRLNLNGWSRRGQGDTTVSLEWIQDFPQQREVLRNVTLNSRLGLVIPTALKADEDSILAFSYGNDGAVGIIFALGIDLTWGSCIQAGLDVQLMHRFGHTRCRRIRTDVLQTDLLLLQKASAYKDYGLDQQFSLYAQASNFFGGTSLKIAYQFYKRGRDEVSLTSNEFSSAVANGLTNAVNGTLDTGTGAPSLLGWTTHDIFVILSYDFDRHLSDACFSPYVATFVDIPFNGKRSVVSRNAGFTLGLNF